jgi:circadian clock protein KaiC
MYFAFEEAPAQIVRNMRSVGLTLQNHVDAGLLQVISARPTLYGFEMHLARMNRDLLAFAPSMVVVDPLTAFRGPPDEVHGVLLRLLDLLKSRGITAVFTSLADANDRSDTVDRGLSSLMDAWLSLRDVEADGERNRVLYLLKVRGMAHSNQVRTFRITDHGVNLAEIAAASGGSSHE